VTELIPMKATFEPGEPVEVEVRGSSGPGQLFLWRLDTCVATAEIEADERIAQFPPQPEGGYGVEGLDASTALDVLADPLSRARYGFVSDYTAGREVDGVVDNVRRLHLNAVQFYDWMYRHARLLPPADDFVDALGRPLSLATVRRLVDRLSSSGSLPLGYAAVYAVGRDEWPSWQSDGLYRSSGEPWTLGDDFLWNVDPTSERWRAHFADDLRAAVAEVGFAGFHLDQYGAPKYALRADGTEVDLAEAFPALINRLAGELPNSKLIFNNVNDFPTWSTASADQAAVYIEVWSPHDRLSDIACLVRKALSLAPEKSVILAAYLSVYANGDLAGAQEAERLLLATAFSHGGSVLLHGEERDVLTEAYYVRHARLSAENEESTRRYYDFAVRYGNLLFDRGAVDVTETHVGGVNEEMRIETEAVVSTEPRAGCLWVRAVKLREGLLVHLIDLSRQEDDRWDAPKRSADPLNGVRISLERTIREPGRFLFAAPDEQPALLPLGPDYDGRYDTIEIPAFRTWALVWIPKAARP
jgi:dextranase